MADRPIPLFYPHVPESAIDAVTEVLRSRWIGQGPQVERFEQAFEDRFGGTAIAVGSGTDALHLAFLLAGVSPGDEVIVPVFTCVATNIPLRYLGATIRFADIEPDTLSIDPSSVAALVSDRTKAIVCTHYGGLPCDMTRLAEVAASARVPLIADCAQALGAEVDGLPITATADFSIFSFQAIKHITTGDGGMLVVRRPTARTEREHYSVVERAQRLRWFGIDRAAKLGGNWDNDIEEVGFKYQMTDIAAAMGLASLAEFDSMLEHRCALKRQYDSRLASLEGIAVATTPDRDDGHAAWTYTVFVERRESLMNTLGARGIESGPVHYRNDRYRVFRRDDDDQMRAPTPNMDRRESEYLVLPLHMKMQLDDVDRVCDVIAAGWQE